MAQGLQVFDENGNCTLDLTRNIAKIIGEKTVRGGGELNVADYGCPNNKFWYLVIKRATSEDEQSLPLLRITDDGKKIMWKNINDGELKFLFGVY